MTRCFHCHKTAVPGYGLCGMHLRSSQAPAVAKGAMTEREQFERWAKGQAGFGTAGKAPDHSIGAVRVAWDAWQARAALSPSVGEKEGHTGWPAGMLQDDDRKLSKALANKPGARRLAEEAAGDIRDAARYRCWREFWLTDEDCGIPDGLMNADTAEQIDAALDAALSAHKGAEE